MPNVPKVNNTVDPRPSVVPPEKRYQLLPEVTIHRVDDGRVILKNPALLTYMVVNRQMARVFNHFQNPTTLDRALGEMIRTHTCPPLHELFELIEQARRRQILVEEGTVMPAARKRVQWWLRLPPALASTASYLMILFGVSAWIFSARLAPESVTDFAIAALSLMGALSLGQALSAGVMRSYDRELHSPRIKWRTAFPHFEIDTNDAQTQGRLAEYQVALVQVAPVFLALGLVALLSPSATGLVMLGVLNTLAPTGDSAARKLLRARFLPKQLDLDREPTDTVRLPLLQRCKRAWKTFSAKFFLVELLVNAAWVTAFATTCWGIVSDVGGDLITQESGEMMKWITLGLFGAVLVSIAVHFRSRNGAKREEKTRALFAAASDNALWEADQEVYAELRAEADQSGALPLNLLKNLRLFEGVPADAIERLAEMMECVEVRSGDMLFDSDPSPDHVVIVCSGRVAVTHSDPTIKRPNPIVQGPGSIIGLPGLIIPGMGAVIAKALENVYALVVPTSVFKGKVVPLIGDQQCLRYALEYNFLRRFKRLSGWNDAAIALLAESGRVESFEAEEVILAENTEAVRLFLVLEGKVRGERKGGKRITYEPGDFFGERGLLDHSLTQEKRIAASRVVCLTLPASAFIRLLSLAPEVALVFERSAERSLGRPLFQSCR